MTAEEAITNLDLLKDDIECDPWDIYKKAIDTAIEALSKRIKKKPISKHYANDGINVCPSCETDTSRRILFGWEKCCPDCGQAILWEDIE